MEKHRRFIFSFWPFPPCLARDSMDALRFESRPWNNEEEIYVLPIKAHWTRLECFSALQCWLSPQPIGQGQDSLTSTLGQTNSNPKHTRVMSLLCVFVPDTTERCLNLSTAKITAQRRLRSHTCIRLTRPQSARAGVFLFLLCAFNPCSLLLFWNVWLYWSGICIHFGGTSSRVNIGLVFYNLHFIQYGFCFCWNTQKLYFLKCIS